MNNPVEGGFTVDYTIGTGNTEAGDITSLMTGTLTFAGTAGEEQDIVVTVANDTIVEGDETFSVSLGTITPAGTPTVDAADVNTSDTATGTIVNTDLASITISDISQNEETGTYTFKAVLNNPVEGGFTVDYTIGTGNTEAGDITSLLTGTLTFVGTAGEEQNIVVTVANDAIVEGDETFSVSLGTITPAGTPTVDAADVNTSDTATGTIVNTDLASITISDISQNEETGTYTFKAVLNNPVEGGFTVPYTIGAGNTEAGDITSLLTGTLTFAGTAGEEQDIVVTVANDAIVEDDETFSVSLGTITPAGSPTVDAADVNTSDTATGTIVNTDFHDISGAGSVAEGSAYTLNLISADPTITSWTVNWGDGNIQTVAGSPATVNHVYVDGNASYTIQASATGAGGTFAAVSTVPVSVLNVAPTAVNDTATTPEDTAVTVSVRGNDTDPAGANDPLVITAVTNGTHGTVTTNGSTVTYTPALNFNGTDSFTYTINDGDGGSSTAVVNVTVTSVNDVPLTADDFYTLAEGGTLVVPAPAC